MLFGRNRSIFFNIASLYVQAACAAGRASLEDNVSSFFEKVRHVSVLLSLTYFMPVDLHAHDSVGFYTKVRGCWVKDTSIRDKNNKIRGGRILELCFSPNGRLLATDLHPLSGMSIEAEWQIADTRQLYVYFESCEIEFSYELEFELSKCDIRGLYKLKCLDFTEEMGCKAGQEN